MSAVEQALRAFISTVENTGGVIEILPGQFVPIQDEEWIDLGNAYVEACAALGVDAQIKED